MPDSILGIKISELPEATESDLTDASAAVVDDGTTTRKTKLSTFVSWLKSKLNIGTMQEDINNLNTKIKYVTYQLSGTENAEANTWGYVSDAGYRAPQGYRIVSVCGASVGWPYASVNPIVLSSGAIFVWYYKANTMSNNLNKIILYITLEKI